MAVEGMSLVSRSLRISSQMLESSNSIRVKKRHRSGFRFGLRVGCDLGCATEVESLVSKSAAKVGCDPVLLGCDLGSVCVCLCVCVFLESLGSVCVQSGLRSAEVESLDF